MQKNWLKITDFAAFISQRQGLSKREIFSLYAQNTISNANSIRSFYYRNRGEIDALVEKNIEVKSKEKVEVKRAKLLIITSPNKILNFLKSLFSHKKIK